MLNILLMKIYTKTGDKGQTSLIGGTRVPKHHLRIESCGTVDELNAYIGLIRDHDNGEEVNLILKEVQDRLFTIGALIASDPDKVQKKIPDLYAKDIALLETEMDKMTEMLPELRHFILPGGATVVSFCHIGRCVCRRAERLVVHLAEDSFVDEMVATYLNRLSDYLFTLARFLGMKAGVAEYEWLPRL